MKKIIKPLVAIAVVATLTGSCTASGRLKAPPSPVRSNGTLKPPPAPPTP